MTLTSYDLAGEDPNPMTKAEVTALKHLTRSITSHNPVIIQIGAERGCSTLAILEERPDAFIFSIDIGVAQGETDHLIEAGLDTRRVVRGLGKSQDIGAFWPMHWGCHMLLIDGDHRRPGIDDDLWGWCNKVYIGGVIALHDYIPNPPEHIKGRVAEAVDHWLEFHKCETILRENRLIAFRA